MTIEEEMNAMLNGEFTSKVMSDEEKTNYEEANNNGGSEELDNNGSPETGDETAEPQETNIEDTEVDSSENQDGETNDEEVAPNQDTQDSNNENQQEDSQPDEAVQDDNKKNEDESSSDDKSSISKQEYDNILKQYEELKAFQEKVTSDFKANGRMVKGFSDPDKIVKNLQMANGLTEKLNGYKKVKPVIKFLENEELIDKPEDLKLAAKIVKGDTEALKYFIKKNNIDATDYIDVPDEDINYQNDGNIVSKEEMLFEDIRDIASDYGVEQRLTNTIINEWDTDSAAMLLNGEQGRIMSARLAEQMSNGVYDKVSAIAENLKMSDYGFRALTNIQQYEEASKIYNSEIARQAELDNMSRQSEANEVNKLQDTENERIEKIAQEKARIEKERLEREYAEKARIAKEEADAKIEAARAAAVSASKPKSTSQSIPETSKSSNDFRSEWKRLMAM